MEKLKTLRKTRVMTLQDLSNASGVSLNTIWRLENAKGQAYPSTIHKLAHALQVEPSELVKLD